MMAAVAAALALVLSAQQPAFTVVLDPGHGGDRDGAISPSGVKEKDVVLELARRIAQKIRKAGGKVVFTRTGDIAVPLPNRAAIATAIRADLFVSVHLNSMPTAEQRRHTQGVETYFLSADASDTHASAVAARENSDRLAGEPEADPDDPVAGILSDLQDADALASSSRLAYDIHEKLVARLGAEDRGVKQAPFYVLAGARMPAVLLEVGFISHDDEGRKLRTRDYQERVAEAVVDGIRTFRSETKRASR
jgi:N-acetylmuramoyl-L-alanine amidase